MLEGWEFSIGERYLESTIECGPLVIKLNIDKDKPAEDRAAFFSFTEKKTKRSAACYIYTSKVVPRKKWKRL